MEKRSRRRIRDLVTHMAFQGLVENEIGCVRISIMARGSTPLQRAGYKCARPIISRSSNPACNTRPVHTNGSGASFPGLPSHFGLPSDSVRKGDTPTCPLSTRSDQSATQQEGGYSITSSARMSRGVGISRPSALAVRKLITRSNLVGSTNGNSLTFSPFRMRPT